MNSLIAAAGVASDQEPGGGNTNLSGKACREIEEKMVMLVLRLGDIISENVLAKNLGIGRTPIREDTCPVFPLRPLPRPGAHLQLLRPPRLVGGTSGSTI